MPRPTPAQFAYGSATVVFSTVAMLLLSRASSGAGVIVIALAGLALGVLVALTFTLPWGAHTTRQSRSADLPAQTDAAHPHRFARARTGGAANPALSEHSLRH
ncbi:hypothetical protein [Streptantibioticus ferralitis]|uniref:Uncharacterized protein n=1 Tax=Streptantibioticus ferralitis TaxID=236510 RepID=A0ABT5YWQ6_9ACTN|nr:hypothetical protein [Streptantibioticus ferralitis]MDF2255285.1 hypothetical protein [Streptantibioticus ferralitis]